MAVLRLFGVNIVVNGDACDQKATSVDNDADDSTISGDEKAPSGWEDEDVSVPVSFEFNSDADTTEVYNPKPLRCFLPDFPIIGEFGGSDYDLVDTTNEGSTSTVDFQEIERNARSKRKRNNEEFGQGKKKRTRVLLNQDIAAAAPEPPSLEECFPGLVQRISESANGTVPELLYTKVLQSSDVCKQQNRLLICQQGQRKFSAFFTPNEATAIDHTREGAQVVVILPRRQNSYNLQFKRWNGSKIMVLNSGWSKLVSECNAKMEDVVQIWGFRENGRLGLAINFVKNQKKSRSSNGEGTSKVLHN